MADAEQRLWGWDFDKEENCVFKDPSSGEPISPTAPSSPAPAEQRVDPAPQLSPSAAGPNSSNTTNTTAALPGAVLSDVAQAVNSSIVLTAVSWAAHCGKRRTRQQKKLLCVCRLLTCELCDCCL